MARYFYCFEDGTTVADEAGTEHLHVNSAKAEAIRVMAELLPINIDELFREETVRIVTTDEKGLVLFTVSTFVTIAPALARVST